MKIKNDFLTTKLTKTQTQTICPVGEAVGKQLPSFIANANAKWYNPVDGNLAILAKLHLPFVLGIALLEIYPIDTL